MKRNAKIIASLIAIFLLGGLSGSLFHVSAERIKETQAVVETQWAGRTLEEYHERLQLTAEQVAALRPEFEKTSAELRRVRQETVLKLQAAIKANSARVMQELTPVQREEFRKLLDERRERVRAIHATPTEHTR